MEKPQKQNETVEMGIGHYYIDTVTGRVAVECCLCDSIRSNMVEHLKIDHAGNPVAERLLKEIGA